MVSYAGPLLGTKTCWGHEMEGKADGNCELEMAPAVDYREVFDDVERGRAWICFSKEPQKTSLPVRLHGCI